jgi:hypothetical protein
MGADHWDGDRGGRANVMGRLQSVNAGAGITFRFHGAGADAGADARADAGAGGDHGDVCESAAVSC